MSDHQNHDAGSSPTNLPIESLVSITEGAVLADSRQVADVFGKRHDNVLRDIDGLLQSSKLGDVQKQWFREIAHAHPTVPGRAIRSFAMTRDGFALLAFGFTGDEALGWKIKYIDAFNSLETELGLQRVIGAGAAQPRDAADPEAERDARDRLFKIYREGHLSPDDLLRALFGKNIPYTSSRRHPFFLTECCEALGISETAAARRLDYSDIATIEVEAGEDRLMRRAITEAALHFLAFSRRSLEPKQAEDQNSNQNSEDWIHIPKSNVGRYILSILPDGKHHYYRSDYNHVIYEADQMNVLALCHSLKTVQALWMAYEEFLEFGIDPCGEHPVRALDDAITRAAIQADRFIEIYTKLAQRKDGAGDDPRNPRRAPGKPMGNA